MMSPICIVSTLKIPLAQTLKIKVFYVFKKMRYSDYCRARGCWIKTQNPQGSGKFESWSLEPEPQIKCFLLVSCSAHGIGPSVES